MSHGGRSSGRRLVELDHATTGRQLKTASRRRTTATAVGSGGGQGGDALGGEVLHLATPVGLLPVLAAVGVDEAGDVEDLQVAVATVFGHGEHHPVHVHGVGDELGGTTVEGESVEGGEEPSQHHLESGHGRVDLGHDEDEALGGGGGRGMDGDGALDLDQGGLIDQRLGVRVDGVGGVGVGNGGDGSSLLGLLGRVELDVTTRGEEVVPVIGRPLLRLLLQFLVLLLVGRADDTPTAAPRGAGAEAHAHPVFGLDAASLHDGADVVQMLALAGDEGAGV